MAKKTSNNIVSFPQKHTNAKNIQNIEEIQNNLEMMRHYHIQETILNMAPMIFNQLDIAGFGLDEELDGDVKDGAFIIEALRSLMCKYYGIYHPFQDVAEKIFSEEEEEKGVFKIVDRLNIKFKKSDFGKASK
jgi:hypothetical protein